MRKLGEQPDFIYYELQGGVYLLKVYFGYPLKSLGIWPEFGLNLLMSWSELYIRFEEPESITDKTLLFFQVFAMIALSFV